MDLLLYIYSAFRDFILFCVMALSIEAEQTLKDRKCEAKNTNSAQQKMVPEKKMILIKQSLYKFPC
jgi:hypothetical protein